MAPIVSALAAIAMLAAPAGCYAPSLRDCTVTCGSEHDCASGQVCGSDGMCASPEVAGSCVAPEVDAGVASDALGDATTPDGSMLATLSVQIEGKGSVDVAGRGLCSSEDPSHGRCMYDITPGIPQRVEAIEIDNKQNFVGWSSPTCGGQGEVCVFVPLATTTVGAKFGRSGAAP